MADAEQSLILQIYDTVLDQNRWPAVLDQIAHMVSARGIIIFNMSNEDGALTAPLISSHYERPAVEAYLAEFAAYELMDQRVFARHSIASDGIDLISDDVLASSAAELADRPNARAMAEFDIIHRAGALLSKDDETRGRFSVQFSAEHGPLGPIDRRKLALYLPHVAKALELARPIDRLQGMTDTLAAALDRLRIGVCLIRADRSVIAQNAEFRRQTSELGIFHVNRNGRLESREPDGRAWLEELIADPRRHGRFGARPRKEALSALRTDGMVSLSVEIAPLAALGDFGHRGPNGYVLYSLDTSRPVDIDVEAVRRVLALTGAETDLLSCLADGLTNREIADRRARSVETINTQVKSLLAKADCANRTQLIRRSVTIGSRFLVDHPIG